MTRCDTNDSANHIDTSALRLLLLLLVAMLVPLSLCAEANAQGSRWIDNVGIGLGAATPPVGATDGKLWVYGSVERGLRPSCPTASLDCLRQASIPNLVLRGNVGHLAWSGPRYGDVGVTSLELAVVYRNLTSRIARYGGVGYGLFRVSGRELERAAHPGGVVALFGAESAVFASRRPFLEIKLIVSSPPFSDSREQWLSLAGSFGFRFGL